MVIINTFFDVSSSIIRAMGLEIDPLDQLDTFTVLFIALFSIYMFIMSIIQLLLLDPDEFLHK